jgi:hypothetical protein
VVLRICECVVAAVLGGLPSVSGSVVSVTRYGSDRGSVCLHRLVPGSAGTGLVTGWLDKKPVRATST